MAQITVSHNIKHVSRAFTSIERKQIPFAIHLALNDTAFATRSFIVKRLWPNSFPAAKNKRFPGVAFRVDRSKNKRDLNAAVFDRLNRAFIPHHIMGNPKFAFHGGLLAIPTENVRRTATGKVPKRSQPRNLKHAFRHDFGKGEAIWQRVKPGSNRANAKGRGLKLMYVLKDTADIDRVFPFFKKGGEFAEKSFPKKFKLAMKKALRGARR